MSIVKKLLHTRYRVNDLERTVKFYTEVLGLTEIRRHKSPRGSELAFLKVPGSEAIDTSCAPAPKLTDDTKSKITQTRLLTERSPASPPPGSPTCHSDCRAGKC